MEGCAFANFGISSGARRNRTSGRVFCRGVMVNGRVIGTGVFYRDERVIGTDVLQSHVWKKGRA